MNKFEVVLIFSPDLGSTSLNTELDYFKKTITNSEGKLVNEEDWGLRDLSTNINKYKKAFYKYFQIEISGQHIDKIKREFNQSDSLLRYLFIKVSNHQELPTKLINEKK